MAKKDKFTLDEFGFDDGLDFPDTDFDIAPPKDDRSPVTKATQGFLKGAKDTAFSNEFVRKFIKNSLPKGYGDALQMAGEGVGEAAKLYNSTAKEIKPTIRELKKVTGRAIPHLEGKVPKGLAEKLKKWSATSDEGSNAQDYRESAISTQLGEIFQEQMKEADKARQQSDAKDAIRDSIDQKRHSDLFGQLEGIRLSTARLASYQDKVTVNFQRKSLELQYRHYYIAADLLEEQKKANEQFKTNLAEIVKNTGLPEYVKLQNSERLGDMMRNKFMSSIYDTIFDKRRGYIGKAVNRLGTNIKDKITGFAGDIQTGIMGADMMLDQADMARDMGMPGLDKYELAGGFAGGMVMDSAGEKIGKKLGGFINKSRFGRKIRTVGNNLEYGVKNMSQIGDKFARGDYDYDEGLTGKIISAISKLPGGDMALDALKDAAYTGRPDQSFKIDGIKDMQGPAIFSNQTRKSINEVIPGFLARIYQELQIIRTGDSNVGLTEYDYGSNKFKASKEIMASALSSIVDKDQQNRFKSDNTELINQIDPEGKLTTKERAELGKFFLSDNFKNGLADPKRFTDPSEFRGVSASTAKKAASLFGSSFGIDAFGGIEDKESFSAKRVKFSNAYGNLGSTFGDSRNIVQQLLNLGQHDLIRELGLINEKGEFNQDQLYAYMSGDTPASRSATQTRAKTNKFNSVPNQHRRDVIVNEGWDQEKFNQFSEGSLDIQKQILDAITNANSVEFNKTTSESVSRVEKILLEGQIGSESKATGSSENKRWYQASIGDIMGSIATGVSTGLSYAGDQLQKGAQGALKWGKNTLSLGLDLSKKSADWLLKKRDEFCDIYIKGEAVPRLQSWRLKAGHYIDQKSGEVIRKLSDIKGTVIDKDGNVILSLEDMKNIIPPDVRSNLKKAIDGMISMGKKGIATVTGSYGMAIDMVKTAFTFAKANIMKVLAKDVYVVGEQQPRLLAITMRVGGYRSKLTGKTIWRPTQIDGPVINLDGEVLLTDADLKTGIVDVEGKPFKTLLSKITTAGKNLLSGAWKNISKAAKWTAGKATDTVDIVTQFIKNGLGVERGDGRFGFGFGGKGSKLIVDRLTEIRDILSARLPERKKKVFGDSDGDGDRENSWQDMEQKRTSVAKESKSSKLAGLAGIGGGKTLKDTKKQDDEEEDDDMDLADAAAGWDLAKGAWRRSKRWGGKLLKGGKKLIGKVGLKGLGLAGAAYGGYSAYNNFNKGNYGEAALDAGIATGGAALTYGASSAALGTAAAGSTGLLAGLGGILGTAGAGIAGILGSPVVLGALALGGAYLGYKYLTSKKLDPLSTYRFAQYGFTVKDTGPLQKVFGLEDLLMKAVDYGTSGASIKNDAVPLKDMLDVMGINPSDKKMVFRFTKWYQYRFKPVFLTHLTALKNIAGSVKLSDVDSKLKGEDKQKYFEASKFPGGPYSVFDSPVDDRDRLTVSSLDVSNAAKVCEEAIKKEIGDTKNQTGLEEGKTAAIASVATASALVTDNMNQDTGNRPTDPKSQDSKITTLTNVLKRTTGIGNETGLGLIQVPEVINSEKQITPLNAIRYRTYGLYDLEIPKINNLLTLEQVVLENMKFTGESVSWDGNIDYVIKMCGSRFGVSDYNTRRGEHFSMWFNSRFLPVFKNYANTIYNLTGKKNLREAAKTLTPSQLLSVANAVYTTKTNYNGRSWVSVWTVPVSPWADYTINTNEATVHDSVNALTDKAKDDTANEKIPSKKADALTQSSLDSDKANNKAQQNTGLWDKTKDWASKTSKWVSDKAGAAWDSVKSGAAALGTGISNAASNAATKAREYSSAAMNAVGTAVNNVAQGIGGMIDQVPMPTASGSWAALKDTISAASKMVGVDEKLMAIMAAIESGFNYSVKAGTSSAKGLYQFIDSTWKYMVQNYGAKYGIGPGTSPTDPRANALLGAEFLKMNMNRLAPVLGRSATYTDMYLAHFMGDGGAKKFLQAMNQNPNQIAVELFPKEANANPTIFYHDGKTRQQPRTLQEIYSHFTGLINKKAQAFKLDVGVGNSMQTAANDPSVNAGGGTQTAVSSAATPAPVATGSKTSEMIANDSRSGSAPTSSSGGPAVPDAAGPVNAGYNQVPSSQVTQQVQTSREDFAKSIGPIDKSLVELVDIQRASKNVLENILEVLKNNGAIQIPNAADKSSDKSSVSKAGMNEKMPTAPISMRKTA